MTWFVGLTGNDADLAPLATAFTEGAISVTKAEENYVLASSRFEELTDPWEVQGAALIITAVLNGTCNLALNGCEPIGVGGVFRRDEEGKRHYYLLADPAIIQLRGMPVTLTAWRADGTVEKSAPDPVKLWATLGLVNKSVANVLRINALAPLDWVNLYRIFEIIRDDVGGEAVLESRAWMPKGSTVLFRRTANSADVLGLQARHGVQKGRPPRNPMPLPEARRLLRFAMWRWLDSKLANPEGT